MGERKVLNKYYPPDFDVALLKKFGQRNTGYDPFKQIEVRMMLPFSVQCVKCGEFSYRGKKFNSRKENVHGEDYKGIKKVRFYMKCGVCSNIFSIKTDPENGDYAVEFGVTRNFEAWKKAKEEDDREAAEQEAEEMGDSMKALENRTLAQKRESDITDALDEVMALNKRNETVDVDQLLHQRAAKRQEQEQAAEAEIARQAAAAVADEERAAEKLFEQRKKSLKRLDDEADSQADESKKKKWAEMFKAPAASSTQKLSAEGNAKRKSDDTAAGGLDGAVVVVKRKKVDKKKKKKKKKTKKDKQNSSQDSSSSATVTSVPGSSSTMDFGDYASSSQSD